MNDCQAPEPGTSLRHPSLITVEVLWEAGTLLLSWLPLKLLWAAASTVTKVEASHPCLSQGQILSPIKGEEIDFHRARL